MSKSATTMIFVGVDRVARLDLGDAPTHPILFSWQSARLPGQSLEQSVEAALDMNGQCGRGVWVLCEDLWTQMLSLSAAAVKGLDGRQLERVLGFELESLSGVGVGESHVAFVPCASLDPQPGQQDYWVTQIASADCRQVQQMIRQAGGKLMGLLHPGGLPLPWGSPGESHTAGGGCATWRRIEVWGDVTLCLLGHPEGVVSTHIIGGSPVQESWRPAVSRWLAGVGGQPSEQVELLHRGSGSQSVSDEVFDGLPGLSHLPEMDGESAALESWLILWAKALGESDDSIPVIRPAAQARSAWWPVGVSIGMAIVALAACLAHGFWMKGQSAEASRNLKAAELPRQQVVQLDQRLARVREELHQLSARRTNRTSTDPAATLAGQRRRIAGLLAALSTLANEDRVVTGLKSDAQGGQTVEGLCLSPESADELAVGLAQRLAGAGWDVRGAQKTARLISPDGGPWEFRIPLIPAGAAKPGDSKTLTTASTSNATSAGGSLAGGP